MSIMPSGTVDVHAHVLDPARQAVSGGAYDLFTATIEEYESHLTGLGIEAGVLVTASVHGTDNEPMLDALRRSSIPLRGIAVVAPEVTEAHLEELHVAGVRGIRVQDKFPGGTPVRAMTSLAAKIAQFGWHIEIMTNFAEQLDWLPGEIAKCRVPVVLDHLGYLPSSVSEDSAAVDAIIRLAQDHGTWVTLSGAYRLAPHLPPAAADIELEPRVRRLIEEVPDRLLWATDWPYVAPPREQPTAEDHAAQVELWLPNPELRQQVLVNNPRECYGFSQIAISSNANAS